MDYSPARLEYKPFLNAAQIAKLDSLSKRVSLHDLLGNTKNLNELGVDFVHSSSKIEGNTYDRLDTFALFELGQTAGGKPYTDAVMLLNMRKVLDHVISVKRIDVSFVLDVHSESMERLLPDFQCGVIRDTSVIIGGSEYVPPVGVEYIREELKYLLSIAGNISNVFERSIYLHLNLAYLQPFTDGNKRVARMIQVASMINGGVAPLLFSESSIKDYIGTVLKYYESGDYSEYVGWFIEAYAVFINRLDPPELEMRKMTDFKS